MADSDDEFEQKKGRDKFRRERNDYDRRSDDRRRDSWEDRRPSARGGQRGWRGNSGGVRRDTWVGRGNNMRDRRDTYSRGFDDRRRGYDDRRREYNFSPGSYDSYPAKRMRRDWEDTGFPGMYDNPFPVSNGPPGSDRAEWSQRGPDVGGASSESFGYTDRRNNSDPGYPTQPAMMTFKQFLNKQDDTISQEDAIKLYADYKLQFKKQQINEFFLAHKEEEWFKSKYHPEEREKQQKEGKLALQARRKAFETLKEKRLFEGVSMDIASAEQLTKILDSVVILLEGGNDLDLAALDSVFMEVEDQSRHKSETATTSNSTEKQAQKEDGEEGELSDSSDVKDAAEKDVDQEKPSTDKSKDNKELALEMPISPEQEELKKKAVENQRQKEAAAAEAKAQRKSKKSLRDKSDYSYQSDSESGLDTGSDTEPTPPGMETDASHTIVQPDSSDNSLVINGDNRSAEKDHAVEKDNAAGKANSGDDHKEKVIEADRKPRLLHQTSSIFLSNLAPNITKQEIEALCRRYPGFKRVALLDPNREQRFFRRGWVTFSKDCNIKEVCWNLNNIRLRDCELGATVNRELKQRIRAVDGITVHKQVMKNDIKLAAKIVQILDKKHSLWDDPEEEKKDEEKDFGFVTKNPVLRNITDYLVDEGSFEEDALIGGSDEEKPEANHEVKVEKDESLSQALDQMLLYLRLVHSVDYYTASEYPNEDEMPNRCGIIHVRGAPHSFTATVLQKDVSEWITNFEKKMKPFLETSDQISEAEAVQLGRKDPDAEVEKFILANTQELSKDKWLCPLSGKKFKGPDFVRKHIFSKHHEKTEEVKQEVKFFNNYLLDPKRPSLPEHPSNKPKPAPPPQPRPAEQASSSYPSPGSLVGYGAPAPGMFGSGAYPGAYAVSDTRPSPETFRRSGLGGAGYSHRRSDPRQLIHYTDLDAPKDGRVL